MDPISRTLIGLGIMFLAALLFDAIGRRTRLPRVTLLIVFGFAVGPSGLDLLLESTRAWFPFVADIALLMVGFLLGGQLTRKEFRVRGWKVIVTSIAVVVATFALVLGGLLWIGVPAIVALSLAAIATATDPAAVSEVVRETHHKSPFSQTLLAVVAVDDVWGILMFSFAFALGLAYIGDSQAASVGVHAFRELSGAVALGVGLGWPLAKLTGRIEPGEPSLYEALGAVLLCGGLALWLEVSFLLAAVTLGATVTNVARHHTRPFHAIEGIEWPFMILFFVLAGASLEIETLSGVGPWLAAYLVLRVLGRVAGAWLGGSIPPADTSLRNWMGIALLPQAGVAMGMALVATQRLTEIGDAILPIVVSATIVFEIIGPIATRIALDRTSAA